MLSSPSGSEEHGLHILLYRAGQKKKIKVAGLKLLNM